MTTKTAPGTVLSPRPAPKALAGRRTWDIRPIYEPAIFAVVLSIGYFILPSSWQYTLTIGVIYSLLATSLGILFGWTGTYTFGHAAFFGMGAYATALLRTESWDALIFLGASAVVAAIAAVVIGLLGGRLVKVEFAMLTMIVGRSPTSLPIRSGPSAATTVWSGSRAGRCSASTSRRTTTSGSTRSW
ncbi:hypothetical protein AX769_07230 [Frondihabitans sp. PAMC 28766]|uniref:ABC transporter permease subunit n=1 Tax=Frondihabitans sp. PAMC 28766 TaxID=1795630 RepID=UPI00078BBE24|nr:hypothetical protein [Frondihabitans sp. PAMC 28766]AMM19991.1 hypothetical protein AX769_07230 [Frondihabitans sp. PAMC 28766]